MLLQVRHGNTQAQGSLSRMPGKVAQQQLQWDDQQEEDPWTRQFGQRPLEAWLPHGARPTGVDKRTWSDTKSLAQGEERPRRRLRLDQHGTLPEKPWSDGDAATPAARGCETRPHRDARDWQGSGDEVRGAKAAPHGDGRPCWGNASMCPGEMRKNDRVWLGEVGEEAAAAALLGMTRLPK